MSLPRGRRGEILPPPSYGVSKATAVRSDAEETAAQADLAELRAAVSLYQERQGHHALVAELKRALAARSDGTDLFTLLDAGR